jgi:hypothetical protein
MLSGQTKTLGIDWNPGKVFGQLEYFSLQFFQFFLFLITLLAETTVL